MNFTTYTQKELQDLKDIQQLNPKEFGIRKKIDIFLAKNNNNELSLVLHVVQKSRFLQRDVDKIEEISHIIEVHEKKVFLKKYILIEAPLCSKAKVKFETLAWSVFI